MAQGEQGYPISGKFLSQLGSIHDEDTGMSWGSEFEAAQVL